MKTIMSESLIPERSSLVAECVRVMEVRIASGEWDVCLPGERRLAEILQVGRDTIRLTLAELESSGWILPADQGCRRRVAQDRKSREHSPRALKIGVLSPLRLERLRQSMLLEVDYLRQMVTAKGGSIELFAPGWYGSKRPEKRMLDFIEREKCSAWILLRSSREVQRCFATHRIPCLLRGYPQQDVELPFLDVDWEATARHAASMLWRLGHRRVGMIMPPDRMSGLEAAKKGGMSLGEEGFELIEFKENGTVEGVLRVLGRLLEMDSPPTALISPRARQVPTVLGGAAALGLRIPDDLSLVSLAPEPFLDYCVPRISGYRVDPEAIARQVIRRLEQLVAGNPSPGSSPWIVPETVKGASVAKAPSK